MFRLDDMSVVEWLTTTRWELEMSADDRDVRGLATRYGCPRLGAESTTCEGSFGLVADLGAGGISARASARQLYGPRGDVRGLTGRPDPGVERPLDKIGRE